MLVLWDVVTERRSNSNDICIDVFQLDRVCLRHVILMCESKLSDGCGATLEFLELGLGCKIGYHSHYSPLEITCL